MPVTARKISTPAPEDPPLLTGFVIPLLVFVIGVYLQIEYSGSLGLMFVGTAIMIPYISWSQDPALNLVPSLEAGKRWVASTPTEIARIKKKMELVQNFGPGCLSILVKFFAFIFLLGAGLGIAGFITQSATRSVTEDILGAFILDTFVLLAAYFGLFRQGLWTPDLIAFKLPVFEALLSQLPGLGMGKWSREFQLELTKSKNGEVPTDVKLVLKPPDCPKEFIGIQSQVAINRGGAYVYFVVITKTGLEIGRPEGSSKDVIEMKADKEVNILVIRQYADKHGGYITSEGEQTRLLCLAQQATEMTVGKTGDVAQV